MSKLKLTLPGLEIPVTGKQISFKAPCDCSSVECLQIDGVDYIVVDALGRQVTGTTEGGVWATGAKVSVILDCEEKKAYLQNGNPTPATIGAGMANHNLLHNWYFGNPVNQRGQTEYTGAGYSIDRWKFGGNGVSISLLESGLMLNLSETTSSAFVNGLWQVVDCAHLQSDTVTLSVLSEGSAYFQARLRFIDASNAFISAHITPVLGAGVTSVTCKVPDNAALVWVQYGNVANTAVNASIVIKAAKLELGSTQTLAHQDADGNWVLNEIPDYSEELLKCCMSTADPADDYANNKKTPVAINAVRKSGDTMTGNLVISSATNKAYDVVNTTSGRTTRMQINANYAQLDNMTNDTNYSAIVLAPETETLGNMLRLRVNTTANGVKFYPILHTGNMESFGCGRVVTGSYVGTGIGGENNPNIISLDFTPQMVVVVDQTASTGYGGYAWLNGATTGLVKSALTGTSARVVSLTWEENSVSWHYDISNTSLTESEAGEPQLNERGITYLWFIIG